MSVVFYYNVGSSAGTLNTTLGSTNSSGVFSTTMSAAAYALNTNNSVYVVVNGQQSTMQSWPSATNAATTTITGTPSLSRSSVTLGLGQSTVVTSQTNPIYMSSNSSPSTALFSANGTQLTITGIQLGYTVASICFAGTSLNCTNLPVTVQSASVSTLSFSQNNISLSVGGSQAVVVSGGGGTYSVSGNSNVGIASASLSGSTLTISAVANGSNTITVCDQSGNCGTVSVAVGSSTTSGSLTFSNANPSVSVGQVMTVSISGGSGYYASGNSNSSVASQSLNGNVLTISGLQSGTTTITLCSASNGCGSLNVTVGSGSTSVVQSVAFGVTNPTLTAGNSMNIGLSGGAGYFVSSNANSVVAQASLSGNTLSLYGASAGSDQITVCSQSGGCSVLSVTVTNAGAATPTVVSPTPTTATPITITPATTVVNSSLLAQIQSLQSVVAQVLVQIQSIQSQLTQLAALVNSGSNNSNYSNNSNNLSSYTFTEFLTVGSQDAEVTALQERLSALGFYSGPITGYFGALTGSAVKQYQTARGIAPATGYIGPSTRAILNTGK